MTFDLFMVWSNLCPSYCGNTKRLLPGIFKYAGERIMARGPFQFSSVLHQISRSTTFPIRLHVCPAKITAFPKRLYVCPAKSTTFPIYKTACAHSEEHGISYNTACAPSEEHGISKRLHVRPSKSKTFPIY